MSADDSISSGNAGGASKRIWKLQTVEQPAEIRAVLQTFNAGARDAAARSLRILAQTSYWVFDPESRTFGPSKFVGYAAMNFKRYERAHAGNYGTSKFDGAITRAAIEKALAAEFRPDDALTSQLLQWGKSLFGDGAFGGADPSKWRFVVLPAERSYWAIVANPDAYRVEDAVAERETDLWTVKRGDVRAGDRIAFWQAKGSGRHRGVVALGIVLTDPAELDEEPDARKYWRDGKGVGRQRRVRVRYVRPPNAPLWLDDDSTGVLETLSVARSTGGGVYRIEPEKWNLLVDALGGWPDEDEEDAAAEAAWEARTRARGQGFATSPAVRKATEEYAMQLAEAHFGKEYEVTRKGKPYDLHCTHRVSGDVLYVEVKGTSTAGEEVFLTPNEVRFAREHVSQMALFVQSGIVIEQPAEGLVIASAGTTRIWQPWDVDKGGLKPVSFVYTLPVGF